MELNQTKFWDLLNFKKAHLSQLREKKQTVIEQNKVLIDQRIQKKFEEFIEQNKDSIIKEVLGETLENINKEVDVTEIEIELLESCLVEETLEETPVVNEEQIVAEGVNE